MPPKVNRGLWPAAGEKNPGRDYFFIPPLLPLFVIVHTSAPLHRPARFIASSSAISSSFLFLFLFGLLNFPALVYVEAHVKSARVS